MSGETIQEVLSAAAQRLKAAGIDQPWREARLLLAEASGIPPATLIAWPERLVALDDLDRLSGWLVRREAQEPLSRILGRREFWSLPFTVTPATLDPRPDSETVIEAALDALPDRGAPLKILDFGTGTGCLLLALLSEYPNAWGVGIDRSADAARVAAANAAALAMSRRAAFVVGDWDAAISGQFDLIVANPPYIASGEIAGLMPAVRDYDPLAALDGGIDGLAPYRRLGVAATRLLRSGGTFIAEIDAGQAADVGTLFRAAGLAIIEVRADLGGIERAVVAKWMGIPEK